MRGLPTSESAIAGVCRAVLELVQNRARTLVALSNEKMGDWAIRVEDPAREPRDAPAIGPAHRERRGVHAWE